MQRAKRVLLFASKLGYQTRAFNAVAEKLDVELVFVTDRCHQLDDPWHDLALAVHFENHEEAARSVVQSLGGRPIDGILALGDRPTPAAAYAARRLGLSYHHPDSAEACRSKLRMREVFRDAGLPTPWFQALSLQPIPEPALLGISYPCVVKPLSLSASQGVVRVNNRDEFIAGATRLKRLLESAEIRATRERNLDLMLVEAYLPGREIAVEGLLTEGELRILAVFEKPDPLEGPYFEETIYLTPPRLPAALQQAVEGSFANTVSAMGLTHGPVHGEFRVNEEGVWPLEIAPRSIGGMCARALRFQMRDDTGLISLEELLLRHALAMPGADAPRENNASGVMMIPVPNSGTFEKLEGEGVARSTPGIADLEITARLHDYITAWPEGSSYLGFLFARGDNSTEVDSAIRAAHAKLRFTLVPRLPVEHPVTRRLQIP